MHHPALAPAPSCLLQHHELSCGSADNTTANFGRSLHQLQADISCSAAQEQSASTPTLQQRPADHQDQPCGRPLSLAYPAMPRQTSICELTLTDSSTSSSRPAVQANNVQPADAGLPIPSAQTRKPSKRNGVRSAMRALLATGAATAAVLAGAATAIAVLSPRVEQLEGRCLQVTPLTQHSGLCSMLLRLVHPLWSPYSLNCLQAFHAVVAMHGRSCSQVCSCVTSWVYSDVCIVGTVTKDAWLCVYCR